MCLYILNRFLILFSRERLFVMVSQVGDNASTKSPASSAVPSTSCGGGFTSEPDAGLQSGIFVSLMLVESGSEIGLAQRIRYVPAMGIISG